MVELIKLLKNNDMATHLKTAQTASINGQAIEGETRQAISDISCLACNHITDRLGHLTSISKLLVLAAEDESNGLFTRHDLADVGYFLESELSALRMVYDLKDNADYVLSLGGLDHE